MRSTAPSSTWTGRLGEFTISDRNRFEGILGVPAPLFRYRNMLRLDYRATHYVGVFGFDEILLRSREEAFHENRATVGVRVHVAADVTIDTGYMLRSRLSSIEWVHDHIGLLSVVIVTDFANPHPPNTTTASNGNDAR
ncbi:MAG: DUF2490 domain-containing protein [Deltaproteobacteria bacterium]|nr:DUF2490 domain-containing protein [Deltaproteobacteria bacterium]